MFDTTVVVAAAASTFYMIYGGREEISTASHYLSNTNNHKCAQMYTSMRTYSFRDNACQHQFYSANPT